MELECTQRLECTQDLNTDYVPRTCAEQNWNYTYKAIKIIQKAASPVSKVGILGINGATYPIKMGPNKIGRDPKTCDIALDLKALSRQHAVINILSSSEYMLMDLGSINKTKIGTKTLQPYIAYPLAHGDMVQFGEVCGLYRACAAEDELPATQQLLDPPASQPPPPPPRARVLVPESPDVSDKDDSFIGSSQKPDPAFKTPTNRWARPRHAPRAAPRPARGRIDNVFWTSSQTSPALSLDDSDPGAGLSSCSDSTHRMELGESTVHEMDTQLPADSPDIYSASTQLPASPTVHTSDTQLPGGGHSPAPGRDASVHNADTQLPAPARGDASVHSADTSVHSADISVHSADISVHSADTQLPGAGPYPPPAGDRSVHSADTSVHSADTSVHSADTQLGGVFEAETQDFLAPSVHDVLDEHDVHDAHTQLVDMKVNIHDLDTQPAGQRQPPVTAAPDVKCDSVCKQEAGFESDEDCLFDDIEDIKVEKSTTEEASTGQSSAAQVKDAMAESDEEILFEAMDDGDGGDLEESQALLEPPGGRPATPGDRGRPAGTGPGFSPVITLKTTKRRIVDSDSDSDDMAFLPTQRLSADAPPQDYGDVATQVLAADDDDDQPTQLLADEPADAASPFKIPILSPLKLRRRDIPKMDERYYMDTQDIVDVLSSQPPAPAPAEPRVVPCSDDEAVDEDLRPLDGTPSPSASGDARVEAYLAGLGSQQVRDVVGVAAPLRQLSSEPSDAESTPRRARALELPLPDTQEIKSGTGAARGGGRTESSSDSEPEPAPERHTPILFKKRSRAKKNAKVDLSDRFAAAALPCRVSTRARRPTPRLHAAGQAAVLRPRFLTSQDDTIDKEILTENIQRLKNVKNHAKPNADSKGQEETRVESKESGKSSKETKNKEVNDDAPKKSQRGRPKKAVKVDIKDAKLDDKSVLNTEVQTKRTRKSREATKEETKQTNDGSIETKSRRSKDKEETKSRSSKDKEETKSRSSRNKDETQSEDKSKDEPKSRRATRRQGKSKEDIKPDDKEDGEGSKKKSKTPERGDGTRRTRSARNKPADPASPPAPDPPADLSAVYSAGRPARGLKRPAAAAAPGAKRPRASPAGPASPAPPAAPAPPAPPGGRHCVLFTAFPNDDVKTVLEELGATIVSDVQRCTVLVTQQLRRTFKLLCCVGLGRPVVGPGWVRAAAAAGELVDPWQHLVADAEAERRFSFSLRRTLRGARGFLRGRRVGATPAALPAAPEMKLIVECSGGEWVDAGAAGAAGGGGGGAWLCVSTARERALWPALRRRGATVVSAELVLSGVLRQRLDVEAHLLH